MTKKIFLISFIIIGLFITKGVFASSVDLISPKEEVGLSEQFYLDLMLDPDDVSINGVEGSIIFPKDHLSFIRAEEGKSIIGLWVESPTQIENTVRFTGIIPNGFDGVIDPFNPDDKLSGLVVRFIFEAIKPGPIEIIIPEFVISLNDGEGTIDHLLPTRFLITINDKMNRIIYKNENNFPPELEATIVRNQDLFNNKFVLVFKATDRDSGIREVLIKEGNHIWKPIKSPYLLKDQTRRSIITLQAINYNGLSTIITIDPAEQRFSIVSHLPLFIFVVILFLIFKKKYDNQKKK